MKTLGQLLNDFYIENGIPIDGGSEDHVFKLTIFGIITLTLPNPEFRRRALYIHDLQHVLTQQNTSWQGEAYISGWEIATGMWKHFPLTFLSLWAMGYGLWLYPKAVLAGYKQGLSRIGIIELPYSKEEFMLMDLTTLQALTTKPSPPTMSIWKWIALILWCLFSQIVFLFPFILAIFAVSFLL